MDLINATNMIAGYTMGMEPSGRELLVVVVKGTFHLPKSGEEARLHEAQLPLIMADTFTGEPGYSAPYSEVDFAPRKLKCDILLQGSAYAPKGRPIERVPVGLRVGNWQKTFAVCGIRFWDYGLTGIRATPAEPFVTQPFSYDIAFGGVDNFPEDPAMHVAFMRNPVGRGFHKHLKKEWVDGMPLPQIEALDRPVEKPDGDYAPMALGPIGRGWQQRACYAGTYDQQWLDDVFPFLPKDFDERYFQAAPLDQQISIPNDALNVSLINFTPDGLRQFTLPYFVAPVHVFPKQGKRENYIAQLDTIVFEPDQERFSMTWRVTRPLKRGMHEIAQVLVGKKGKEWWQQREQVKFPLPVVMVPMHAAEASES